MAWSGTAFRRTALAALLTLLAAPASAQSADPDKLLAEADRLG